MQAAVGDRFHVRGGVVGQPKRAGEIVEVRGAGGGPPYPVRFDDERLQDGRHLIRVVSLSSRCKGSRMTR